MSFVNIVSSFAVVVTVGLNCAGMSVITIRELCFAHKKIYIYYNTFPTGITCP